MRTKTLGHRTLPLLTAALLGLAGCKKSEPDKAPAPARAEAPKAAEPPPEPEPAVEAAEPEPAEPEAAEATPPAPAKAEADALAAALLGTGDKANADGVVARSARRGPVRRSPSRRAAPVDEANDVAEPEEAEEPLEPEDEVPATLSDARFSRVVSNWRGVKDCLTSVAARGDSPTGSISIAFEIASDGSVRSSKISAASNDTARQIAPCVTRQARKIKFPAYSSSDPVSKEAKFVF